MKYQIVSNGLVYRIEVNTKFLWFKWSDYYVHRMFFTGVTFETPHLSVAEKMMQSLIDKDEANKRGFLPIKG